MKAGCLQTKFFIVMEFGESLETDATIIYLFVIVQYYVLGQNWNSRLIMYTCIFDSVCTTMMVSHTHYHGCGSSHVDLQFD